MARLANQSNSVVEDVNLLLCAAWEHGARHVSLRPQGDGLEISYLGSDGGDHKERLSLHYKEIVMRLRELSRRFGRVRVDIGGHQWQFDAVIPGSGNPNQVFLHMRPADE